MPPGFGAIGFAAGQTNLQSKKEVKHESEDASYAWGRGAFLRWSRFISARHGPGHRGRLRTRLRSQSKIRISRNRHRRPGDLDWEHSPLLVSQIVKGRLRVPGLRRRHDAETLCLRSCEDH